MPPSPVAAGRFPKFLFVAHGRDAEMLKEVEGALFAMNVRWLTLTDFSWKGRTIIEKLIDASDDVDSAIVLVSPDDRGYYKRHNRCHAKPRARQNVIFELGFFMGKLDRENVIAVCKRPKDFEKPSDIQGVGRIYYTRSAESEEWKKELAREIEDFGFEVNRERI